jgi:hypothetical protein
MNVLRTPSIPYLIGLQIIVRLTIMGVYGHDLIN